jgi:putative ABC transport system permease protein
MASNYPTYVLLKPGADPAQFQSKLKLILTKYYLPVLKEGGVKEAEDFTKNARLLIQPIKDIRLHSSNIR